MADRIYIGIDGGGTKTTLIATDKNFVELYRCTDGASNFLAIGLEKASANIINLIKKASLELDLGKNFVSIVVGAAGAGRKEDADSLEGALKIRMHELNFDRVDLFVTSDANIALEGAFNGGAGALLIAGTGSILFGKNLDGEVKRVSGFGRILGDEGSGYTIGLRALKSVAEYYDGRAPLNQLVNLFAEKFDLNSLEDIITKVYKENFDIASVVPTVLEAAENNDETSLHILYDESEQLLILANSLREKLGIDLMYLAFMGSLISNENIYSKMLKEKLFEMGKIIVVDPMSSPELGAIMIGKRRIIDFG